MRFIRNYTEASIDNLKNSAPRWHGIRDSYKIVVKSVAMLVISALSSSFVFAAGGNIEVPDPSAPFRCGDVLLEKGQMNRRLLAVIPNLNVRAYQKDLNVSVEVSIFCDDNGKNSVQFYIPGAGVSSSRIAINDSQYVYPASISIIGFFNTFPTISIDVFTRYGRESKELTVDPKSWCRLGYCKEPGFGG